MPTSKVKLSWKKKKTITAVQTHTRTRTHHTEHKWAVKSYYRWVTRINAFNLWIGIYEHDDRYIFFFLFLFFLLFWVGGGTKEFALVHTIPLSSIAELSF